MNESPFLRIKPSRHASAQSPTRHRLSDDILAHLGPATAVDALSSATGALWTCLENASVAEREFAVRTAVASKSIWEWVEELQDWPWPSEEGSAGFEPPGGTRRKLFVQVTVPEGHEGGFMGSLPAEDVDKYEKRITEIEEAMEQLDVEEIKSHVLTHHILPLSSRPGTPLSDSNLSTCSNYTKMEDITAVITAIVVQALPNLAKLSRLLHVWNLRLCVLRRIPSLLLDIEDAEVALKSGWKAISMSPRGTELEVVLEEEEEDVEGEEEEAKSTTSYESALTRKDFDVMKLVLEKKISKPGRTLDYMLDHLEGMQDTLPDEWLDRMEAVETEYAEWVASCEQKMRETDWVRKTRPHESIQPPSPEKKSVARHSELDPVEEEPSDDSHNNSILSEASEATTIMQEPSKHSTSVDLEASSSSKKAQKLPELQEAITFDGIRDRIPSPRVQPPTPVTDDSNPIMSRSRMSRLSGQSFDEDSDESQSPIDDEEDELDLPPFIDPNRRSSDESSNDLRDISSRFGGSFSDLPEVSASPNLGKGRIREAEYLQASPPSSPINGPVTRRSSLAPTDSPMLRTPGEDDDYFPPSSPPDASFLDDFEDSFSISEVTGPYDRRESVGDQHLRQQISQIIGSIPARIKLSTGSPAVNLNPPDIQLPRMRRKTSTEPFRRSASNMSSRATTPSFTLSPAKNPRPKRRGQQEIKVYHLSRPNGEKPIKLFIRCVGENGERVMVRVGGGWADLGEYLKEYANHHKRRSSVAAKDTSVEVRDAPRPGSSQGSNMGSSPPARPSSSHAASPMSPLAVRKTRRSVGAMNSEAPRLRPTTPGHPSRPPTSEGVSPEESNRSRSSSHVSWVDDDSSPLGLAGPTGKKVEMSEENRAWVESIKEKVRLASGDVKPPGFEDRNRFGELGRVGGTKRLFRKPEEQRRDSSRQ